MTEFKVNGLYKETNIKHVLKLRFPHLAWNLLGTLGTPFWKVSEVTDCLIFFFLKASFPFTLVIHLPLFVFFPSNIHLQGFFLLTSKQNHGKTSLYPMFLLHLSGGLVSLRLVKRVAMI